MTWRDCGFREDLDVARYYGLCPHCGGPRGACVCVADERIAKKMPPKKPGDYVNCPLCGGDGYVSHETAAYYGRPEGDSTCPSCDGRGLVVYRPLPSGPHWTRSGDV